MARVSISSLPDKRPKSPARRHPGRPRHRRGSAGAACVRPAKVISSSNSSLPLKFGGCTIEGEKRRHFGGEALLEIGGFQRAPLDGDAAVGGRGDQEPDRRQRTRCNPA